MTRAKRNQRTQRRGGDGKSKRKRPARDKQTVRWKVYPHPTYGDIPMVPVEISAEPGKVHRYLDFDPDFAPPMPRGAVRGDIRKQQFCRMCHVPRYFYVDRTQRCVQCDTDFLFSAEEQKYWYETLKFHFDSVAIRCKKCRQKRRSEKALHRQLSAALVAVEESPDDPARLVAMAEATVQLWDRTGRGNLDRAIAAARKAEKLWPDHAPSVFWQARCQEAAGRRTRAIELYARFCGFSKARTYGAMWSHAQAILDA